MAAVLTAALLLVGCAALRDDEKTAATETASKAGTDAAETFDIRVELADQRLRELIEQHNTLQRYRTMTDLDDSEWERLLVLAERDVRNLLGAEGWFSPQVTLRREGGTERRPTVVIEVQPGTRATISEVRIAFEGDIATSTDPDVQAQRQKIVDGWTLPKDRFFSQSDWSDAKTAALRQLVERRYPRGQISFSAADVDAQHATVKLDVRLNSGPPFRLGAVTTRGAKRYPERLAQRLSWLKPGDLYDQNKLVQAQQRLTGSGYYDSAYISIDSDGKPNAVPVTFTVTEAKRYKVQVGVGFSTDSGARVSLEHRDNSFLGTSWRSDAKLNVDRKSPLAQVELTSLPSAGGWRKALFARQMRQDDGSLVTTSQTLRAGFQQNTERYDRNLYLQYEHALVGGAASVDAPDTLVGDGAAVSAHVAWTGRYFDALPLPRLGFGLQTDFGLGLTMIGPRQPFARWTGRWIKLVPLGKGSGASRLALRGEWGAIIGAKNARLPGTDLFRTGGDTTVRGYAWRSIGIPLGGRWIGPGRYMALGSVEWQRPILQDRFPGLLEHTVFVDVGGVANRVGDLRPNWGVGTGVRLITPAGPMDLAVARGLQSKQWRLHLTVGFNF
ncbi:MAG: BamA/TamA family outer membrane protein [Burkholderiaceae bacterium]|nr:BamA/TamA family outer membrane protein [Burkholderiaceae bacterium]